VRELFHELLDLSAGERRRVLDERGTSAEVRSEVESLLELYEAEESEDETAFDAVRDVLVESLATEEPAEPGLPERIGAYRVVERLGEGGAGIVYRAVQEHPQREVAIKVLRSLAGETELRRFEYEAEILARLDHPFVAKVIEAGVEPALNGLPYIVMELVDGQDLLTYCEARAAPRAELLALFADVCDGVQHAHQHGVVHRDLKPSNILVSADGRPRILDFGIARPTEVGDADASTPGRTMTGSVVGTLAWMSPEQARGDRALDVRSDVYSLGAILHRLLTGEMPYDVSAVSPWEAARTICEDEPRRLGRIDASLRGDLEAIAAMALEKDPARRYAGAGALGRDVRRFLELQPVEARPWSTTYQLAKFARRNRGIVVAAALGLLALVAGAVLATAGFLQARAELARSNEIGRVLSDTFSSIRPEVALTRDTELLRELLDSMARRLDAGEVRDPRTEGELRATIGETYMALLENESALPHLTRAVELLGGELGRTHSATVDAEGALARIHLHLGLIPEAVEILDGMLARGGLEPLASCYVTRTRSNCLAVEERWQEALDTLLPALEEMRRLLPADDYEVSTTLREVGWYYEELGRLDEAESILVEVMEIARSTDDASRIALSGHRLAKIYERKARWDEALKLAQEAYPIQRDVFGAQNDFLERTRSLIVRLLLKLGRDADTLEFIVEELAHDRRPNGTVSEEILKDLTLASEGLGHPDELVTRLREEIELLVSSGDLSRDDDFDFRLTLARLYGQIGQTSESIALFAQLVDESGPEVALEFRLNALNGLAVEYTQVGRIDEALQLLETALRECGSLTPTPEYCVVTRHSFGETLLAGGLFEAAALELEEVVSSYLEHGHEFTDLAFGQLHESYEHQRRTRDAEVTFGRWIDWKRRCVAEEEAGAGLSVQLAMLLLDAPYPALRDPKEALERARDAVALPGAFPEHQVTLARCLDATGRRDEAVRTLRSTLAGLPADAPAHQRQALEGTLSQLAP
jgi:serine/threonine protein kinase